MLMEVLFNSAELVVCSLSSMVKSDHKKKKKKSNLINGPATVKSLVAADVCQTHVVFISHHFIGFTG